MLGVNQQQIRQARAVDLLSWLQVSEPDNLCKVGGGYCQQNHDSLKISNSR